MYIMYIIVYGIYVHIYGMYVVHADVSNVSNHAWMSVAVTDKM